MMREYNRSYRPAAYTGLIVALHHIVLFQRDVDILHSHTVSSLNKIDDATFCLTNQSLTSPTIQSVPGKYIIISLQQQKSTTNQPQDSSNCSQGLINHLVYDCNRLNIHTFTHESIASISPVTLTCVSTVSVYTQCITVTVVCAFITFIHIYK